MWSAIIKVPMSCKKTGTSALSGEGSPPKQAEQKAFVKRGVVETPSPLLASEIFVGRGTEIIVPHPSSPTLNDSQVVFHATAFPHAAKNPKISSTMEGSSLHFTCRSVLNIASEFTEERSACAGNTGRCGGVLHNARPEYGQTWRQFSQQDGSRMTSYPLKGALRSMTKRTARFIAHLVILGLSLSRPPPRLFRAHNRGDWPAKADNHTCGA